MNNLEDTALKCINKLLYVETQYGWGWSDEKGLIVDPINNFKFRLMEIPKTGNSIYNCGFGRIEDTSCSYNNFILEFTLRHEGIFNFDNNPPVCNLFICSEQLHNEKKYPRKGLGGFGLIKNINNGI